MDIEGKIALVIGGASGIGLCCVKELIHSGVKHVTIADCNVVAGESALKDLQNEVGTERVSFIKADVTKFDELEDAFTQVLSSYNNIDIVINCAGIVDGVHWEKEVDINLNGTIRCTLLALEYMGHVKGGKGGILCNTASIAGLTTATPVPVYTATKHGVVGLSRTLGHPLHFKRTGVRIVTMCPGVTDTPMTVNMDTRILDDYWKPLLVEEFNSIQIQQPENVAKGMMTLIREASSGSVWVSEGEQPVYEVDIPHYETLKKKT